jgi:cellulase/cellobiase CelA1
LRSHQIARSESIQSELQVESIESSSLKGKYKLIAINSDGVWVIEIYAINGAKIGEVPCSYDPTKYIRRKDKRNIRACIFQAERRLKDEGKLGLIDPE